MWSLLCGNAMTDTLTRVPTFSEGPASPRVNLPCIGHEQALAEPPAPELADELLRGGGHEEIRECSPTFHVDTGGVLGVPLEHVIHVVQRRVALHQRHQAHAIPPTEIGGNVREDVRALLLGHLQGLAHALTRFHVPHPRWGAHSRSAPQL